MICDFCGEDFPHGQGTEHVLIYGANKMCMACMLMQTHCVICGKRRMGKNEDGVCPQCAEETLLVTPTPPPRRMADWAAFGDNPQDEVPDPQAEVNTAPERAKRDIKRRNKTYSGKCDGCGAYSHSLRSPVRGNTELKLCMACTRTYGECDICGEVKPQLKMTNRGAVCKSCRKEHGLGKEERWNYTPRRFIKHGESADGLFFGIENEVNLTTTKNDYIHHIAKHYSEDDVYMMYDGTIPYGTELVMHPRSFESLKEFNFDQMLVGVEPSKNTGMHVHLSRSAFHNKLHLYKFMRFISKNKGFIEKIAERSSKVWRAWRFTDHLKVLSKVKGYQVDEDKYVDVNLRHPNTIELRIFKGATTVPQLRKNIEFCHALWTFSKIALPKKMTRLSFLKWLENNPKEYPNLIEFLERNK